MSSTVTISALALRRNFMLTPLFIDIYAPENKNIPVPPLTPDKRSQEYYQKVFPYNSMEQGKEEENWKELLSSAK
jgi:hypothetical protein